MPTREQMDRVTSGIEVLMAGLDVVCLKEGHVIPASPGQEGGYYFWDDLSETQRPGALTVAVGWDGFTESQREGVISRVLEGDGPDSWMDGIEVRVESNAEARGGDRERGNLDVLEGAAETIRYLKETPCIPGSGLDQYLHDHWFNDDRVWSENSDDGRSFKDWAELPEETKLDVLERFLDDVPDKDRLIKENVDLGEVPWDVIPSSLREVDGQDSAPEKIDPLHAEILADEHAARVRDYGETDAATHVARMEEAYRYREQAIGPSPPDPPPVTAQEMERALNEIEESWDTPHDRFKAIMRGDSPSVEQASVEQERGHER